MSRTLIRVFFSCAGICLVVCLGAWYGGQSPSLNECASGFPLNLGCPFSGWGGITWYWGGTLALLFGVGTLAFLIPALGMLGSIDQARTPTPTTTRATSHNKEELMKGCLIAGGIVFGLLFLCGLVNMSNPYNRQGGGQLVAVSVIGAFIMIIVAAIYYSGKEQKRTQLQQSLHQAALPSSEESISVDLPAISSTSSARRSPWCPHCQQPVSADALICASCKTTLAPPDTAVLSPSSSEALALTPSPSEVPAASSSSSVSVVQEPKAHEETALTPSVLVGPLVSLGLDQETDQVVALSQAARLPGLYVIGVNGTGKSTFLSHLIAEDMQQGLGLCLLDPHGDLTTDVLAHVPQERLQDVILLDLMDSGYPFGLNLFACPDPTNMEQVALTASFVMHVFEKVWDVGPHTPQLAQMLRNTTFTLIQNPGTTLAELPLLLQDEDVRRQLVANVKNNPVKLFWQIYQKLRPSEQLERTSSTINKADAFLTQPIIANIVGQSSTTIDFRKLMDEGKILLVQLTPQLEDLSRLVGAVIIGQLLAAAMSRKDIPENERRQFHLYADEYQRFATADFATLLSEARKFQVGTTIAHQYLDQLDEGNRGAAVNAANLVAFRVSGQDAEVLAKEFDATPEEGLDYRTEPIRTPGRDVLSQLSRKGHRNPDVTGFYNRFIAPAQEYWENRDRYIQMKDRLSIIDRDEFLKRPDLGETLEQLNNLLFEAQVSQAGGNEWSFSGRMIWDLLFINDLSEGFKKLVKFDPSGSITASASGAQMGVKLVPSLYKPSE